MKIKIKFWLRFAGFVNYLAGFVNYQQERFWEHSGPDMGTALGLQWGQLTLSLQLPCL